ncbi:MAG: ATP-dependent DNA helicase RecQ [Bacteroidota bacterium]
MECDPYLAKMLEYIACDTQSQAKKFGDSYLWLMPTPLEVLQKYWGYAAFRPGQQEIIDAVLAGQDNLALLPTGGGKSICYQVPALCLEGVTLVISPLIALMKDQVQQLQRRGIVADALYSGLRKADIDRILDNAVYGNLKLLYLSPERLQTDLAKERIRQMPVSLIAVDEAHCISQWGYDFRPSYLQIADIRPLHPEVPTLAVTATATPEVVSDIQQYLSFRSGHRLFQKSFARDNLNYVVRETADKGSQLIRLLKNVPGSSIVYVRSRRKATEIAQALNRFGFKAAAYHAGLEPDERDKRQADWIEDRIRVMVATNAFGMGIDKPDVRSVVHWELPDSPEAYFQEAGRGGRDGKESYALLIYQERDAELMLKRHEQAYPSVEDIRRVYRALGSYLQLAIGGGLMESYDFQLDQFAKTYSFDRLMVYYSLRALEKAGYLLMSEAVHQPARLRFLVTKEQLYDYQLKNKQLNKLLKSILRTSQGAFVEPVRLREGNLANFLGWKQERLQSTFKKLASEGIIDYFPTKDAPQITLLTERLEADNLDLDLANYYFRRDRDRQRIDVMIRYATQDLCRSVQLLRYFGEKDAQPCGRCDVCRTSGKRILDASSYDEYLSRLQAWLAKEPDLAIEKIKERLPQAEADRMGKMINHWVEEGKLKVNHGVISLSKK